MFLFFLTQVLQVFADYINFTEKYKLYESSVYFSGNRVGICIFRL